MWGKGERLQGEKAEKSFWGVQSQQNTPSITEFKNELTQVTQVKKKAVSLVVLAQEIPLGPGKAHSSGITFLWNYPGSPAQEGEQTVPYCAAPFTCTTTAKDTEDFVGSFLKSWMKLHFLSSEWSYKMKLLSDKFWSAHQHADFFRSSLPEFSMLRETCCFKHLLSALLCSSEDDQYTFLVLNIIAKKFYWLELWESLKLQMLLRRVIHASFLVFYCLLF